jgi:hypothetical protein
LFGREKSSKTRIRRDKSDEVVDRLEGAFEGKKGDSQKNDRLTHNYPLVQNSLRYIDRGW